MSYRIDSYDGALVIEGFEQGVANSPYAGIADMRNVNITPVPGEASVGYATELNSFTLAATGTIVSATTGAAGLLEITGGSQLVSGMTIYLTGPGLPTSSGPTGLTAGSATGVRYVIGVASATAIRLYSPWVRARTNQQAYILTSGTGTWTTVPMGPPRYSDYDAIGGDYALVDYNGRVYFKETNTNTSKWIDTLNVIADPSYNHGNGIVIYEGFIMVATNTTIDYLGLNSPTGIWNYSWQSLSSNVEMPHPMLLGVNDNYVYVGNLSTLAAFHINDSASDFDPADASTYTYTAEALQIPSDDQIMSLTELGDNLLIGGRKNIIYPWNRTAQVSGKSINSGYYSPLLLSENGIYAMVTVNTNTYVFAGNRGRIWVTNGSQASIYAELPDHISGVVEPYYEWGTQMGFGKNQLYFGARAYTNDGGEVPNNSTIGYGGLWAIDMDSRALRLINKLSYGNYGGLATVVQPIFRSRALGPSEVAGNGLYIGWRYAGYTATGSTGTFGVDITTTGPYTNSEATIESDLIPIGTFDKPKDATRIEYKLVKPLVSGESITIYWRLDYSQDWTQVYTDNTAGAYSGGGPINWKNAQWLQFKIVLNSTSTDPSFVRLKEIRLTGMGQ